MVSELVGLTGTSSRNSVLLSSDKSSDSTIMPVAHGRKPHLIGLVYDSRITEQVLVSLPLTHTCGFGRVTVELEAGELNFQSPSPENL